MVWQMLTRVETFIAMKHQADHSRTRNAANKIAETPEAASKVKKTRATATRASTRKKKATPTTTISSSEEIAVAAYLNWCHRRNQGLPDDPIDDWIRAETGMELASEKRSLAKVIDHA